MVPDTEGVPGKLSCRLEVDGQKSQIDNDELLWSFQGPAAINIEWQELNAAEPWHVTAYFQGGPTGALVAAMDAAEVQVQYQSIVVKKPIAETLRTPTNAVPALNDGIRLHFASEDVSIDTWNTFAPSQLIVNRLTIDTDSELGRVQWTISPSNEQVFDWRPISWDISGVAPWVDLAKGALSSNGDILFEMTGLQATSYRIYLLSLGWQEFSGISSQVIAADIWRDGAYQRISQEASIPLLPQSPSEAIEHTSFAILDFEGAVGTDGRLQFILRRLRPDQGPIVVNAVIIHPYR